MGRAHVLFDLLPLNVLDKIYRNKGTHWRYSEVLNEIRIKKYLGGCIKRGNGATMSSVFCEVREMEWDYSLFNIAFFENAIRCGAFCLTNGQLPVFTFANSKDKVNLWETIMEQPFGLPKTSALIDCEYSNPPLWFNGFPPNDKDIIIKYLYNLFWKPNMIVKEYFEAEYRTLLEGKRVLGVLSRGADYTALKLKDHARQPKTAELIVKAKEAFSMLNCDAIYLATEEYRVQLEFEKAFPGKVIINKRVYDQYYKIDNDGDVQINGGIDTNLKSVSYLSSINLLSKCCGLVAGCCGGSRAAYYLNNGKYEYCYLFNLGVY